MSDQNFVSSTVDESRLYAENNATVYTYVFDYYNDVINSKPLEFGVVDGMDCQ